MNDNFSQDLFFKLSLLQQHCFRCWLGNWGEDRMLTTLAVLFDATGNPLDSIFQVYPESHHIALLPPPPWSSPSAVLLEYNCSGLISLCLNSLTRFPQLSTANSGHAPLGLQKFWWSSRGDSTNRVQERHLMSPRCSDSAAPAAFG